jgi:hypothetical protein
MGCQQTGKHGHILLLERVIGSETGTVPSPVLPPAASGNAAGTWTRSFISGEWKKRACFWHDQNILVYLDHLKLDWDY